MKTAEAIKDIECIVVGQKWNNDVNVVLFVVLKDDQKLSQELTEKIKKNIRTKATPRHIPANIYQVKEIPRTISGKKVEIAVTKIINSELIENEDVLANPSSLEEYRDITRQIN